MAIKEISKEHSNQLFQLNYEINGLYVYFKQILKNYKKDDLKNYLELMKVFNNLLSKIVQNIFIENYFLLSYSITLNDILNFSKFDYQNNKIIFKDNQIKDIEILKTESKGFFEILAYKKIDIKDLKQLITDENKDFISNIIQETKKSHKIFNSFIQESNKNNKEYYFYDFINNNLIFYNLGEKCQD